MPSAILSHTASVQTELNYHLEGEGDRYYAGTADSRRRKHVPVETLVTDMRGHESDFSVDDQGFQMVQCGTAMEEQDFLDVDKLRAVYYRECAELVQEVTGASRVHVMSHIVRRQSYEAALEADKAVGEKNKSGLGPTNAHLVHVDHSVSGAMHRLKGALPEEADALSSTRWAIINVWRPIQSIRRDALAMCDTRSMPEACLKEFTVIFPGGDSNSKKDDAGGHADEKAAYSRLSDVRAYEVLPPEPKDRYQWYYASAMQPHEALLLKIFDSSKKDGVAKRSAHSSFKCPSDCGPARQSLEVRCLVFWEDQE